MSQVHWVWRSGSWACLLAYASFRASRDACFRDYMRLSLCRRQQVLNPFPAWPAAWVLNCAFRFLDGSVGDDNRALLTSSGPHRGCCRPLLMPVPHCPAFISESGSSPGIVAPAPEACVKEHSSHSAARLEADGGAGGDHDRKRPSPIFLFLTDTLVLLDSCSPPVQGIPVTDQIPNV